MKYFTVTIKIKRQADKGDSPHAKPTRRALDENAPSRLAGSGVLQPTR